MHKIAMCTCLILIASCSDNATKAKKPPDVKAVESITNIVGIMAADSTLQPQIIDLQATEALESASGGEDMNSTLGLMLTVDTSGVDKILTKTCTTSAGIATITVNHQFERITSIENPTVSFLHKVSSTNKQVRTWSKEGATLVCDGKHAKIDWNDNSLITNLKLKITTSQIKTKESTVTNTADTTPKKLNASITTEATRNIEWKSVNGNGAQVTHTKQVTSDASQTVTIKNSQNEEVKTIFHVATKEGSPLIIEVMRYNNTLASKTIVQGTIVANIKNDGKIETAFTNLQFAADDTSGCSPTSGTFTTSFFNNANTLLKTINCIGTDGIISCEDTSSGKKVSPITPQCDSTDAK